MPVQFKKIDRIGYCNYINSFLVDKKVRDAFLIQNFSNSTVEVDALIKDIQDIFPSLNLFHNS